MSELPKLVRDRVPQLLEANGFQVSAEPVQPPGEILGWLIAKLHEEALEVETAPSLGELVDVLEVLHQMVVSIGAEWDDLEDARRVKNAQRGSFAGGWILRSVD